METIDPELSASQEKDQRNKLHVSRDMKSYQEQGHNDPFTRIWSQVVLFHLSHPT